MIRAALALVAVLALPACATGPGSWQGGGWQGSSWDRGGAADVWAAHAVYPYAAGWWGGPPPTAAAFGTYLAGHGRWVGYGQYGRVWLPSVGPGWQPYRHGHWIEHPRWGRTWLSGEPFGWITYHYGRWGFDPRLGWFWVPGYAFAPHWADVRWSGSWLGWAPLPPPGWAGWGGWRWGAGGWGHGYPGWVYAPRSAAYRPGWTARSQLDSAEFERMQRAPAPVIPQVTPVAPPVVAQPSPVPPTWNRATGGSGSVTGRPAWQARTQDRSPQDGRGQGRDWQAGASPQERGAGDWRRRGRDESRGWQEGAAPQVARRPPPAVVDSTPAEAVAVRPGLASPVVTERPARAEPRSAGQARPERSAPPARPAATRGGLEQGASASEP